MGYQLLNFSKYEIEKSKKHFVGHFIHMLTSYFFMNMTRFYFPR